jgi:carboxypeptidase C (cathepsin A)
MGKKFGYFHYASYKSKKQNPALIWHNGGPGGQSRIDIQTPANILVR